MDNSEARTVTPNTLLALQRRAVEGPWLKTFEPTEATGVYSSIPLSLTPRTIEIRVEFAPTPMIFPIVRKPFPAFQVTVIPNAFSPLLHCHLPLPAVFPSPRRRPMNPPRGEDPAIDVLRESGTQEWLLPLPKSSPEGFWNEDGCPVSVQCRALHLPLEIRTLIYKHHRIFYQRFP